VIDQLLTVDANEVQVDYHSPSDSTTEASRSRVSRFRTRKLASHHSILVLRGSSHTVVSLRHVVVVEKRFEKRRKLSRRLKVSPVRLGS
jgi:hypothetical protein